MSSYLEISKENLRKNIAVARKYLPDGKKIIAVVKDNFYGHGAVQLVKVLIEEGINDFAVSCYKEAKELRDNFKDCNILILGYVSKEEFRDVCLNNISVNISSMDFAYKLEEFCKENNLIASVDVAVDTGMSRNGVNIDISDEDIKFLYDNQYFLVKGTYTHLATADSFLEKHKENTYQQQRNFDYFLNRVRSLGLFPATIHFGASATLMNYPELTYDAVRLGFMLLGFDVGDVNNRYSRYPLLSWYSNIISIRTIKANQSISYGHTYTCQKDSKIATISVGYGDGYPRRLSNKGYVLINGQRANIVGRICMDQMMVDVSDIENISVDDKVVLVGNSGNQSIFLNDLARLADTIVDEIVCDINFRVERRYI